MKIGLVLEGGAMRGLFTAGILDVMMEHDITPDGLIGVSDEPQDTICALHATSATAALARY